MTEGEKYGFNVTVQDKVGVAKSAKVMVRFFFSIECDDAASQNVSTNVTLNVTQTIS